MSCFLPFWSSLTSCKHNIDALSALEAVFGERAITCLDFLHVATKINSSFSSVLFSSYSCRKYLSLSSCCLMLGKSCTVSYDSFFHWKQLSSRLIRQYAMDYQIKTISWITLKCFRANGNCRVVWWFSAGSSPWDTSTVIWSILYIKILISFV